MALLNDPEATEKTTDKDITKDNLLKEKTKIQKAMTQTYVTACTLY